MGSAAYSFTGRTENQPAKINSGISLKKGVGVEKVTCTSYI
jgi:hypothetical protein